MQFIHWLRKWEGKRGRSVAARKFPCKGKRGLRFLSPCLQLLPGVETALGGIVGTWTNKKYNTMRSSIQVQRYVLALLVLSAPSERSAEEIIPSASNFSQGDLLFTS